MSPYLNKYALTPHGEILKIINVDRDERYITLESDSNDQSNTIEHIFNLKILTDDECSIHQILNS